MGSRDPRSGRASAWFFPCHAVVTPEGAVITLTFTGRGGLSPGSSPLAFIHYLTVRPSLGARSARFALCRLSFRKTLEDPWSWPKASCLSSLMAFSISSCPLVSTLPDYARGAFTLFGIVLAQPLVDPLLRPYSLDSGSGINIDFGAAHRLELRTSQPATPGSRSKKRNAVGNQGPTNPDGPELSRPGL